MKFYYQALEDKTKALANLDILKTGLVLKVVPSKTHVIFHRRGVAVYSGDAVSDPSLRKGEGG